MQREKGVAEWQGEPASQDLWGNCKRYNIHLTGIPEGEGRENRGNDGQEWPKLNDRRLQITDAGSSENTKQEPHLGKSYSNYRKTKTTS